MHLQSADQCGCREAGYHQRPGFRPAQAREASAAVQVQSHTKLTVETAEGDRVVISVGAQARLAAASREGRQGSAAVSGASTRSQVQVSVEGNLSETELADIQELIGALGEAAGEARQGGEVDLSALAGEFSELESLAGFQFRYSQTVSVGALLRVEA